VFKDNPPIPACKSPAMDFSLTADDVSRLRESASKACALLKALANEDRLLILCQLTQGERNVGELEAMTGVRQPTLSQQLGVLRDEGLVSTRREGKYIFYGLASHEVIQVMKTLSGLYCGRVLGLGIAQ
jgi:DNA-binding transcriptional ArsR family regulator